MVPQGTKKNARRWCWYDNAHIDVIPRYGENFSKPKKRVRKAEQRTKAKKEFTGAEVYALLNEADAQLYVMILLGLNCGFGNADCARLQTSDINREWLATHRGKTGVRCRKELVGAG